MKPIKSKIKNLTLNFYINLPISLRNHLQNQKIAILLYHEISADLFADHIDYIESRYNIVSLYDLKKSIYKLDNYKLPKRPLLITFDDGWHSNYELLKILKPRNIRATIFATTGLVNTNRAIWNYTLDRTGDDLEFNNHLKKIRNSEKNLKLFKHNGYYPKKEYPSRSFLTLEEIKEMSPYVDFQSHGEFHPVFPMCSDEELRREISASKKYIEAATGHTCYAIAWPYGRFQQREIAVAKQLGYRIGRMANEPGLNTITSDPLRLKSIGIDQFASVSSLNKCLAWAEIRSLFSWTNFSLFRKNPK